jgi:hypothetical protein
MLRCNFENWKDKCWNRFWNKLTSTILFNMSQEMVLFEVNMFLNQTVVHYLCDVLLFFLIAVGVATFQFARGY